MEEPKKKTGGTLLQQEMDYIDQIVEMIDRQSAHTNKRWNDDPVRRQKKESESGGLAEADVHQNSTDSSGETSPIYLRIKVLMEWYVKKATASKRNYYVCSIATTTIPLIVTVINTINAIRPEKYSWLPVCISVLSGLVCLISAWLTLSRSQENWVRYRSSAEMLKRETMLYLAGLEPYKKWERVPLGNMDNDRLLVQNIEKIVQDENQSWEKTQHKTEEPKDTSVLPAKAE